MNKINCIVILFFLYACSFGQIKNFQNKRQIEGTTGTWNRIIIPDEMYVKLKSDLSDLRVIGFTKDGDTIEAPYLISELSEHIIKNQVRYEIINTSNQGNRYYYTFEVPSMEVVNEIILSFDEGNFDRYVTLEGSNQQTEWFTILDEARILSIDNKFTNYSFTSLSFNESKYRYYRISFQSKSRPKLVSATVADLKTSQGSYRSYDLKNLNIIQDRNNHETIITCDLPTAVPVSFVKIMVKDSFDYYRPIYIQMLTDSAESQKGMIYNYETVSSNVLSSLEPAVFKFPNTFMGKIRIVIANNDNEPLNIDKMEIKGNLYQMIVRIVKPANYYLYYGYENSQKPIYDLLSFKDKIPDNLNNLSLGPEESIDKAVSKTVHPLFENKLWLWAIMLVIIILLGGFTYKMMKK